MSPSADEYQRADRDGVENPHGHKNRWTFSDPDQYPHSQAHEYRHCDEYPGSFTHAVEHIYPITHTDAEAHPDSHCHEYPGSFTHSYKYQNTEAYKYANEYTASICDTNFHVYPAAYQHAGRRSVGLESVL